MQKCHCVLAIARRYRAFMITSKAYHNRLLSFLRMVTARNLQELSIGTKTGTEHHEGTGAERESGPLHCRSDATYRKLTVALGDEPYRVGNSVFLIGGFLLPGYLSTKTQSGFLSHCGFLYKSPAVVNLGYQSRMPHDPT